MLGTGAGVQLREELILPELAARDKDTALREVSSHLCQCAGDVNATPEDVLAALLKRERLGSTGVGEGVAIPHARIPGLRAPVACIARTSAGVPFEAIDAQPVHFIFALLVPEGAAAAHVRALACISRILMDAGFRQRLCTHATRTAIYRDFVDAGFGEHWNVIEG
jgi:PTS system nitrogen regulatory IIA component